MSAIRLRPHHVLCALTYAGHGYSLAFRRNFDRIAADLKRGRPVQLVAGPDDVCAGLNGSRWRRHCTSRDVRARDQRALSDLRRIGLPIASAFIFTAHARRLRSHYQRERIRSACAGCSWKPLCDGLAAADFAACRLGPAPKRKRSRTEPTAV